MKKYVKPAFKAITLDTHRSVAETILVHSEYRDEFNEVRRDKGWGDEDDNETTMPSTRNLWDEVW